jgi:hypothetical protein
MCYWKKSPDRINRIYRIQRRDHSGDFAFGILFYPVNPVNPVHFLPFLQEDWPASAAASA